MINKTRIENSILVYWILKSDDQKTFIDLKTNIIILNGSHTEETARLIIISVNFDELSVIFFCNFALNLGVHQMTNAPEYFFGDTFVTRMCPKTFYELPEKFFFVHFLYILLGFY